MREASEKPNSNTKEVYNWSEKPKSGSYIDILFHISTKNQRIPLNSFAWHNNAVIKLELCSFFIIFFFFFLLQKSGIAFIMRQ